MLEEDLEIGRYNFSCWSGETLSWINCFVVVSCLLILIPFTGYPEASTSVSCHNLWCL